MTPQNDFDLTALMRRDGVRSVEMVPEWRGGGFIVHLTCGGHAGHGETVGDALANAKELNADYLEMAA